DSSGFSVSPTARLSMLKPREASIPEMWARTPGWFCTSADKTCRIPTDSSFDEARCYYDLRDESPERQQREGAPHGVGARPRLPAEHLWLPLRQLLPVAAAPAHPVGRPGPPARRRRLARPVRRPWPRHLRPL